MPCQLFHYALTSVCFSEVLFSFKRISFKLVFIHSLISYSFLTRHSNFSLSVETVIKYFWTIIKFTKHEMTRNVRNSTSCHGRTANSDQHVHPCLPLYVVFRINRMLLQIKNVVTKLCEFAD